MRRFRPNVWDFLIGAALVLLVWNRSVVAMPLAAIAFLLYLLVRYQFSPTLSLAASTMASSKENEFVVERKDNEVCSINLDVNSNHRPLPNHFLVHYRYDSYRSKRLHEYRVDGHDVFCRLLEDGGGHDLGMSKHDVRDGVVLESEIRERDKDKNWSWFNVDENIAKLKKETEWQKVEPLTWHGLKYFILSKKLPQADARRYLRQELERFKTGTAAFFKEAEKYGLRPDENSLDRLRVADGKPQPSDEELKRLNESCSSFGITDVEFSWGKKLTAVLERLLSN
jgi:hypothetical protein